MADFTTDLSTTEFSTSTLFDVETYPLNQPDSDAYGIMLEQAITGLDTVSCAQLPNFIRPEIVEAMQREAAELADGAVFHEANLNPYFSNPPEDTPEDHPLNRFSPRRHGMVRGDKFARDGVIWAVFQNPDLCRFVAQALWYEKLYTYRDPYACTNVNVQPDGCEFAWHFDNNDFTVSFGLKQSDRGGDLEYVPNLRSRENENYDAVKQVLDGDRTNLRTLKLRPGDLQLFRGGYTLHRVTAPQGSERQSLLLSYVTNPTDITTSDKAIRIWGEAHPDHFARDEQLAQSG
ncbi:hypothetical protein QEZ52_22100 (plasmid) [Aliisedimentitalea scapharcae]|uniref:Fe2OG dioxygenase domain-containing protein n=1 Tax=Aliisedimentitalea scapharcae TaxID=1524259 RepID=A0ABZ2XZA7_9RHOB